ncbi:MAG: helix-turn-helix domain-containing protein [Clostridiales Family XIII bacterium]|jgi:predicted site-specific integrase-resolvase|nr:helix-turn-helix domain-containing protein [Clostridiales Family XIII bacterium]
MEYMTASEAAKKWGVSSRRVHSLCSEGRIEGVSRLGNAWAIPKDAEKPKDARIKNGKYIKRSGCGADE